MDIFNKSASWVYECAKLNFLMILGILRGGVVFGLGPALLAGGEAVHDLAQARTISLQSYFKSYKQLFVQGNRVILPLVFAQGTLLFGYSLFAASYLSYLYLFFFLYSILILWIVVALSSYYEPTRKNLVLLAIRFSIFNIFMTVILCLVNLAIIHLITFIPGLIPFFLLGSACMINMYVCYTFFVLNDKKLEEEK